MRVNPVTDVLKAARDLLAQPYTWSKGKMRRSCSRAPGGYSFCALGAIEEVSESYPLYLAASFQLKKTRRADTMAWNDAPERRKADVLDAFDKAIDESSWA